MFCASISDPPSINDIFLRQNGSEQAVFAQNSSVDVICQIDKGNPPIETRVRLLREDGTELKPTVRPDDLHVKHVIQYVQCNDMGYVSCDMQETGARDVIVRKHLLVKCECLEYFKNKHFCISVWWSLFLSSFYCCCFSCLSVSLLFIYFWLHSANYTDLDNDKTCRADREVLTWTCTTVCICMRVQETDIRFKLLFLLAMCPAL